MMLNLTIGVTELNASEVFYRDLLGLQVTRQTAGSAGCFLLVSCGNCQLVLQPVAVMVATHPALFQSFSRQQPGSGVQFELTCPHLGEVEKRLAACQWPIVYELDDQEHQRREIWVHDPDGYLLVLNQE